MMSVDSMDITVNFSDQHDAEAVLVHWVYDEGAFVHAGDMVAEAMVDKVTLEIEAPTDGFLVPLLAANEVFRSGQTIGHLTASKSDVSSAMRDSSPGEKQEELARDPFIPAPPAVRRYAEEKGVPLAEVRPRTPGKRLSLADVDQWLLEHQRPPTLPYSPFRQALIEHLTDPGALPTTLHRRMARGMPAAEVLPQIAWALTQTLPQFPRLHGWADAQGYTSAQELLLGIASQTSQGLLVPVLRQQNSLDAWNKAFSTLRTAIRNQTLNSLDFSPPSFVISNLGARQIEYFTPRLMSPTIAILGIGAVDSSVPVSLTFDHRAVDGAEAAEFLMALDKALTAI